MLIFFPHLNEKNGTNRQCYEKKHGWEMASLR